MRGAFSGTGRHDGRLRGGNPHPDPLPYTARARGAGKAKARLHQIPDFPLGRADATPELRPVGGGAVRCGFSVQGVARRRRYRRRSRHRGRWPVARCPVSSRGTPLRRCPTKTHGYILLAYSRGGLLDTPACEDVICSSAASNCDGPRRLPDLNF